MDFKGTLGKWHVVDYGNEFVIENQNHDYVSTMRSSGARKYETVKANAQLMAKAPELLDALSELVCAFENDALSDVSFAKNIIKEATELNVSK